MDDLRDIEALKYQYVRLLDTHDWDALATCLTPDLTSNYGGMEFADRDALIDFLRANVTSLITMHHVHHPEISLMADNPDEAVGRWYLNDKVFAPDHDFYLEGAAFYEDRYVRTSDGWKIAHTGYVRTWELTGRISALGAVKGGD